MNPELKNIISEIDSLKKRLNSHRPLNQIQLKKIEEAFFGSVNYELIFISLYQKIWYQRHTNATNVEVSG